MFDLFVEGRIEREDAMRQERTAKAILERFNRQPGVVLADEVGMGKTYVAMAVACAVSVKEKKPVVIMIPPALQHKWPADFRLFREYCVKDDQLKAGLKAVVAEKPEEFFKYLDNNDDEMPQIIFLTYGALGRSLTDSWVKLAILQRVLRGRHDTQAIYKSLSRHTGVLIEKQALNTKNDKANLWLKLYEKPPTDWKKILVKLDIFDTNQDDPVPASFIKELNSLQTSELNTLYTAIKENLPKRDSVTLDERLDTVRKVLREGAKSIWKALLKKIKLDLPLLIFDEAHHLKNAQTQLVRGLFEPQSEEDAGLLAGQFDRMLFLTATPFQLGHDELLSVLQRFNSIKWNSLHPPLLSKEEYAEELRKLKTALDDSQLAARRLDRSWSNLKPEDIRKANQPIENVYEWWQLVQHEQHNATVKKVLDDFTMAKRYLLQVQPIIIHFVIRHLKSKFLPGDKIVLRRELLPGNGIRGTKPTTTMNVGLQITQESLLPFLLAARLTTLRQDERPVFAEGLASSYEAFRFTREQRLKAVEKKVQDSEVQQLTDFDDDRVENPQHVRDDRSVWYLDQLEKSLRDVSDYSAHPKIRPTVEKAIELWSKGEKVLIFCHYVETGKALRKYISAAMRQFIWARGAEKYKCAESDVDAKLQSLSEIFKNKNSSIYQLCATNIGHLVDEFLELVVYKEDIIAAVMRFLSSPSFLVRFAASPEILDENDYVNQSFNSKDQSGFTLLKLIQDFLAFLNNRVEDREEYIQYLKTARTEVTGKSLQMDEDPEEQEARTDHIIAAVRLCYGQTPRNIRQKLMKTFNTPFFPDILITSSVMGEGVDLHLYCRHIIHHDLCWNPSTLEQRTGRVDRIGAKAEKAGMPIQVYLPYVSETQDEKMYRVVMERERWFNIIMGEKYKVDAVNTDKYAERIALPEELARELSFDLSVK